MLMKRLAVTSLLNALPGGAPAKACNYTLTLWPKVTS
jgi:hypothetical protein